MQPHRKPQTSPIGRDTPRVDGPLKVTGVAQYTSDFHFPGLLYAVPVEATIASGKITTLDTAAAEKMPGVRAIFHRENIGKSFVRPRGRVSPASASSDGRRSKTMSFVTMGNMSRSPSRILSRPRKPRRTQSLLPTRKRSRTSSTNSKPRMIRTWSMTSYGPRALAERARRRRGAFASAPVKLDQTYVTPAETHNPIELQAATAMWDGDNLTIYEESQGIVNMRGVLAQMFGLPKENVRVITKFVGSGFGSKLWPWTHCPLAVAAARQLGKPVKLVLSRKMTFQSAGHRARTQQQVRLGATSEGKLVSLQHDYVYHRSMLDDYHENCGEATSFHYSVPNLRVHFGRARRNIGSPSDMRGPGAVPGLYATESAMNELADQLKMDPVRLRVLNEPKIDEGLGIPFSSRHYLECLELGAEKFGWSKRNPEVGAMKRDGLTLGWGMAGAAWIAARFAAAANVELRDDGTARVACATQDIGTGTYTILAQLASEKTGVPLEKVEVVLGDTSLPQGPTSGGSMATGSLVPAVFAAATTPSRRCCR